MNPLTDTLQSCPFCGAHAFLVGGVTEFEVKCCNSECGARGLPHSIKSHAIAAWNRRAEVEAARAALEVKTDAAPGAAVPAEPDMLAVCAALGFDPTNHHNAAKCPYCSPVQPGERELP